MSTTASKVRIVALIASIAVIVILILQNTEEVSTKILFATVSMPRAVLLLVTGGIGFLAGLLVRGGRRKRPG